MSGPRVNCIGRISTIQFEPRYGREDDTMKARLRNLSAGARFLR